MGPVLFGTEIAMRFVGQESPGFSFAVYYSEHVPCLRFYSNAFAGNKQTGPTRDVLNRFLRQTTASHARTQ